MTLTPAQRQSLTWAALSAIALILLWLLAPVLTPFIVAAVLAYALHPAVERLAARRVPRVLAVVLIEVAFIVALLAVLLLIVPILSKELPLLREQIPTFADRAQPQPVALAGPVGHPCLARHRGHQGLRAEVSRCQPRRLAGHGAEFGASIGGSILLAVIGNAILVPVVLFYLLLDWPQLVARAHGLVPPRMREKVSGFLDECDGVLGQYLRGQLLVMLILAVGYSIGLALFGFDLALPVGVFTGLAIFIPYVGFGLGLLLALLAGLLQFASCVRRGRRGGGVRHRPGGREPLPHAAAGGRAHRHESADGHLRAARLRPPVRLRRRADRAACQCAARRGGAAICARSTSAAVSYRG